MFLSVAGLGPQSAVNCLFQQFEPSCVQTWPERSSLAAACSGHPQLCPVNCAWCRHASAVLGFEIAIGLFDNLFGVRALLARGRLKALESILLLSALGPRVALAG